MAVSHDTASESDAASTGSVSQASFSWSHSGASSGVKGVLVFTFVNANADDALSVTYGGLSLVPVTNGRAVDTLTEPGDCKAWFYGVNIPQGTQTVVVNRNNNANVMYAVAITVLAADDVEVFNPVLLQENQALSEQPVNDACTTVSVRYAGVNSGLATHPAAGASSTELHFFPATAGTRSISTVRETTAGTDSRSVGFSAATDDVAAVHLVVREVVRETPYVTVDLAVVGSTSDADGTTLTTAIYKGMGFQPDFPATFSGLAAGQTINADQDERPRFPVLIRGCGIASKNAHYRSYRLDNSLTSPKYTEFDMSAITVTALTVFGLYKSSVANDGPSTGLYDVIRLNNSLSDAVIMQLDVQTNFPGYAMNIESIPTGPGTTHSPYIPIIPGRAYWINIHSNLNTGIPKLAMWDLVTGNEMGTVQSIQDTVGTAGAITAYRVGNAEVGVSSGAFTYLQLYLDYTTAKFPIPPPPTPSYYRTLGGVERLRVS